MHGCKVTLLQPHLCMQAVPKMSRVASSQVLVHSVLPQLLNAAEDDVPNVKFNLCKVLQARYTRVSIVCMHDSPDIYGSLVS